MTIVRIGATKKYTQNWGLAFSPQATTGAEKGAPKPKTAVGKKGAKKQPAKGKGK